MGITAGIVIFITGNKMCCNVITKHYNIRIKLNIYFRKYLTYTIIFPQNLLFLNLREICVIFYDFLFL